MVLVEETCGKPAEAMRFKNSVYDPQMSSAGGRVIELVFRNIDPSITATQLANIIRDAHSSGALEGKRFRDFFPFMVDTSIPTLGIQYPGRDTSWSASSRHTLFIVLSDRPAGA